MIPRIGITAVMAAIGFAALPAMAASPPNAHQPALQPAHQPTQASHSPDWRYTYAAPSRHQAAPFALPAAASVLFSNFASAYPNGLYFSGEGNTITGPGVLFSPGITSAAQFTPAAAGTATSVYAAVGYISGNSLVDVSIYTDAGGVPGTALVSAETGVKPVAGACCQVIKARFPSGVALSAGTPYWVVIAADSPSNSTFSGAWALSTTNQVSDVLAGTNFDGAGWKSYPTNTPPAFAVTGD